MFATATTRSAEGGGEGEQAQPSLAQLVVVLRALPLDPPGRRRRSLKVTPLDPPGRKQRAELRRVLAEAEARRRCCTWLARSDAEHLLSSMEVVYYVVELETMSAASPLAVQIWPGAAVAAEIRRRPHGAGSAGE
jgi:hypothetical protein